MKNIYIAGSYSRRKELLGHANELEAIGYNVTSRWLRLAHEKQDNQFKESTDQRERLVVGQPHAIRDVEDVSAADTFVLFADTIKPSSSGGAWFEMGLAHGLCLKLHVIGRRVNIFCCLPEVQFHGSWQDFLTWARNREGE